MTEPPADTPKMKKAAQGGLIHYCFKACLQKFGRRDWTRTNDPHHVKVVL
jgi:hypothetical protein